MRKLTALLLALLLICAVPAFAVEEGELRVAALYDISTMDVAHTTDNYMIPMNVFDRLFDVEGQGDGTSAIVPRLAVGYSVSEDGLTYSFELRDGVVFSNGSAFTAEDVKYSFERLLTEQGVNDDIPLLVVGAEELQSGQVDELAGIVVEDDLHLSITLKDTDSTFIEELSGPAMGIVDKETMQTVTNFGIEPADTIGTGAYKVTEWVVNDHYTLEYNDKYWGEEPSVKKMVVSIIPDANTQSMLYQSGDLDIIDLENQDSAIVAGLYQTAYADKLIYASRIGMTYLAMNENNAFLSDVNVRKAIQMAVDVDTIIAGAYGGAAVVQNGIIPQGIWGFNEQLERTPFDPDAAKALLKDAGYEDGQISFELAFDNTSSTTIEQAYQIVQANLKAIGINAEIRTYDDSSWLDLRNSGEMDAFIANWSMDYNDPANIMYTFFGSPEKTGIRSLNYKDADTMARVAAAASIKDDAERMAEYQALEKKIVVDDAAWVPLLGPSHLFALGDRVESFIPHWAGFSNFYARQVTLK